MHTLARHLKVSKNRGTPSPHPSSWDFHEINYPAIGVPHFKMSAYIPLTGDEVAVTVSKSLEDVKEQRPSTADSAPWQNLPWKHGKFHGKIHGTSTETSWESTGHALEIFRFLDGNIHRFFGCSCMPWFDERVVY